jgi:hypothetical protein
MRHHFNKISAGHPSLIEKGDPMAERITIDVPALRRTSSDLNTVGGKLSNTAGRVEAVRIGRTSFGLMNAALVPQVNELAEHSKTLLTCAGELVTALGRNADRAATEWENTEQTVIDIIRRIAPESASPAVPMPQADVAPAVDMPRVEGAPARRLPHLTDLGETEA